MTGPRRVGRGHLFHSLHILPYRKDEIMTTTFSVSFAALSIDCADLAVLADFWGKAFGRPVSPEAVAGDVAVEATDQPSGPSYLQGGS